METDGAGAGEVEVCACVFFFSDRNLKGGRGGEARKRSYLRTGGDDLTG